MDLVHRVVMLILCKASPTKYGENKEIAKTAPIASCPTFRRLIVCLQKLIRSRHTQTTVTMPSGGVNVNERIQDEGRLAELGYTQELLRDWGWLQNFGASFSIINVT